MLKITKVVIVAALLALPLSGCSNNTIDPTQAPVTTGGYIANPNTDPTPVTPPEKAVGVTGMGNGSDSTAKPVDPATVSTHKMELPNTNTLKVKAGDKIDISMYNQTKNTLYSVDLYYGGATVDAKQHLESLNSDNEGNVTGTVTIPDDFAKGIYTLALTLDGNIFTGNVEIQ